MIERNLKRLQNVAETVRVATDIARGRLRLRPVETDLRDVVRQAIEAEQDVLKERDVAVTADLQRQDLTCDPAAVGDAAARILQYAIKRTLPGGQVQVRVEAKDGEATCTVTDQGAPLSPADQRSLFDPFGFLMGDNSTGDAVEYALRFYVARLLIEAHGGTLQVQQVGKSTRYRVALPIQSRVTERPRRPVGLPGQQTEAMLPAGA